MDYEKLLRAYIRMVADMEGACYAVHGYRLTAEETMRLDKVEQEEHDCLVRAAQR